MMLYLIPILIALTLLFAVAGGYYFYIRSRRISDRLQRVVDGGEETPVDDEFGATPLPLLVRPIAFLGWILPGHVYSDTLFWEMTQAGFQHSESRKLFSGIRVITTTILGVLAAYVTWTMRMQNHEMALLTLLGAAIGFYAPMMYIRWRQSKRQMEITLSLPDALDLLVICVEAGQGLNAALLRVGKESQGNAGELSNELLTVNNEMRAGMTRTQALRNFAMRTGVDDVRALVAVMIQSDRFGTSIAQALRIHAQSLRTRRRQRAEEAARKAPVKMVFPLVFCIFPELLVVILAPGMLALFRALSNMNS